jgi:hypothetical protein
VSYHSANARSNGQNKAMTLPFKTRRQKEKEKTNYQSHEIEKEHMNRSNPNKEDSQLGHFLDLGPIESI